MLHISKPSASSFLGRDAELSEMAPLLEGARLVTLTGPPGIGKSRLAFATAAELAERYPDGVYRVELAPLSDTTLIPRAVAAVLGLSEAPGQKLQDTLVARLSRQRALLVLDNCEHLLPGCAKLVAALLAHCPSVSVLATSREPLQVSGETVWHVPPLGVPAPSEPGLHDVERYAAVRLFVERAQSVQPGFSLNPYVAPAVAEICRRLDGIPLAIELAAARVETLTPAEIARRLDDRFGLLTNGSPSALPHHQTLLGALDWSHELLSGTERALLRRLSVFVGGFDLEAAEAVCPGAGPKIAEVSKLLGRLAAKSLVAPDAGSSPVVRYRLLETVRAYAGERLEEAGEAAALRAAHARYYLALAERAEPELTGLDQRRWLGRLESERGNLRSAFDWSLGHGESEWALRLAGSLVLFWRVRCHYSDGRELIEAAIAAGDGGPPALRAKALWGAGFLAVMMGDLERAVPALEQSLAGFRELGDLQGHARALLVLGNALQGFEDPTALPVLEQSASLARAAGDRWCLAHALGVTGFERAARDDLAAATELFEECLEVARAAQDEQSVRMGLIGLGSVAVRGGDYRSGESLLAEALAVSDGLGESYSQAMALHHLGLLAFGRGDYQAARHLSERALALFREGSPPAALLLPLCLLADVARAEDNLARARRLLGEALGIAPSLAVTQGMGGLAVDDGDLGAARDLLEETLVRARSVGARESAAEALFALAELTRSEGDADRAAPLYEEALGLYRAIGNGPRLVSALEAVAGLALAAGSPEHSARLLGAAQALRDARGYCRPPWESARYGEDLAHVRTALGPEALAAAEAKGERLSLAAAGAQASKLVKQRASPAGGLASLTRTERQVAVLAAEGLTNPEIAERLFIAMGTVKAHLSHIFQKLGVLGRTQLAREVWRLEHESPKIEE